MSEYNEPWAQENGVIYDSSNTRHPPLNDDAIDENHAARIVACVNACAGISDEDLKFGVTKNFNVTRLESGAVMASMPMRYAEEMARSAEEMAIERIKKAPDAGIVTLQGYHAYDMIPKDVSVVAMHEKLQAANPYTESLRFCTEHIKAEMAAPAGVMVYSREDGKHFWRDREGVEHNLEVAKPSEQHSNYIVANGFACPDCYVGLNGQVEKCGRCKGT